MRDTIRESIARAIRVSAQGFNPGSQEKFPRRVGARAWIRRQDAFLILKLATYSSGLAGSKVFPMTENDL
jgi:hypothetical protein